MCSSDLIGKTLSKIEKHITGVNVDVILKPIKTNLEQQTKILQNLLEEQTISRKITEGSLSFDSNKGQYRNKSGREFASNVTGKITKKGGFVDFETAGNRYAGQNKRVVKASEQAKKQEKNIDEIVKTQKKTLKVTEDLKKSVDKSPGELIKSISRLSDFRLKGQFIGGERTAREHLKEGTAFLKQGLTAPLTLGKKAISTVKGAYGFGKNAVTDRDKAKAQILSARDKAAASVKNAAGDRKSTRLNSSH